MGLLSFRSPPTTRALSLSIIDILTTTTRAGVDREEAREEAREDRELLEGGWENFLTSFNKETTGTARRSPSR